MANNNSLNVTGRKMIFKNEKGLYSTTISNKKPDGTYENMYISVGLPRDREIENKTVIDIKNAFLSFYTTGDEESLKKNIKLVVMDFEETMNADEQANAAQADAVSEPTTQNAEIGEQGQIEAMWEDELPF